MAPNSMACMSDILGFLRDNVEAIVALSALALTIQQGYQNRRHSRLSVKPYLSFDRIVSDTSPQIEFLLHNSGIGPAFIKRFEVYLDGTRVNASKADFWGSIGRRLHIPLTWGGGTLYFGNEAIPAGKTVSLAKFKTVEAERDHNLDNEHINKELDRLSIVISYESSYGENFTVRAYENE